MLRKNTFSIFFSFPRVVWPAEPLQWPDHGPSRSPLTLPCPLYRHFTGLMGHCKNKKQRQQKNQVPSSLDQLR